MEGGRRVKHRRERYRGRRWFFAWWTGGRSEDDWGEPVACFIEERNALEAKRQLEREGHTTSIRPFRITYRDEQEKRTWLADYEG